MIIGGLATNWTKSGRGRKTFDIDIHPAGHGHHGKRLTLVLVQGDRKAQKRCAVTISGEDQLRAIADLISRTLTSDAECIVSLRPGDPPIQEIEMSPSPLAHRSEDGAAHHLK